MKEGFGRNLGGFWEAFRSPGRHPEAPQEAPRRHPGQPRRPEASWRQSVSKHVCFFLIKVARPTFSPARERPDPHEVRSRAAKVGGRGPGNHPGYTPPSL